MWICRRPSSVTALHFPSLGPISITRHQRGLLNSPSWSHRRGLARRNPWGSSWLNLMSTQLSWHSWAAELTSLSTSIESVSITTRVSTLVYRPPTLLQARHRVESGQEWKSPKRVPLQRGCQQTLKGCKIALRRPVRVRMSTPWYRSAMKMMCSPRHINLSSSSKLAWPRRRPMSTKRCSLSRGRPSTWPPLRNSFSKTASLTTNQRNTNSSNVKTSQSGAHCPSLCSRLRNSYRSSLSPMFT